LRVWLGMSSALLPLALSSRVPTRTTRLCGVALAVQKFGGSSVADARPDSLGSRTYRPHPADQATTLSLSVSAMGKTTDELLRLADDVSKVQPGREIDMLLTSGERISMALVCMALAELGNWRPSRIRGARQAS